MAIARMNLFSRPAPTAPTPAADAYRENAERIARLGAELAATSERYQVAQRALADAEVG